MNKVNSKFKKQLSSIRELVFDLSRQNHLLLEFLKIQEKNKISYYLGDGDGDVLLKKIIKNSFLDVLDCNCDNEKCVCKDDDYNLFDLDDLFNHLKIHIEGMGKMRRLLIYNTMNLSYCDIENFHNKYEDLKISLMGVNYSMEKYKEMKREELKKEENMDEYDKEELIEYFRKADELKELNKEDLKLQVKFLS